VIPNNEDLVKEEMSVRTFRRVKRRRGREGDEDAVL
jgi:hypothetical protein